MRNQWYIKIYAITIIVLALLFFAYNSNAEDKKPGLQGWGNKLFEVLDQEVQDTKSYQKKQWEKMKRQFKNLFNRNEKEWNELDE
tara:strand:+ start:587 stop:841 length:255 start_codon:yes stop_codon:yes gene_type:complete